MSLLMATLWNALQNYTSLSVKDPEVIIEKVEPPNNQNPYKYLLEDKTTIRSLYAACAILVGGYIFVKVNFCMFRALRGVLTIIGLFTVCCYMVDKYESLPEPVILALNSIRLYGFQFFKAFHKYVTTINWRV